MRKNGVANVNITVIWSINVESRLTTRHGVTKKGLEAKLPEGTKVRVYYGHSCESNCRTVILESETKTDSDIQRGVNRMQNEFLILLSRRRNLVFP